MSVGALKCLYCSHSGTLSWILSPFSLYLKGATHSHNQVELKTDKPTLLPLDGDPGFKNASFLPNLYLFHAFLKKCFHCPPPAPTLPVTIWPIEDSLLGFPCVGDRCPLLVGSCFPLTLPGSQASQEGFQHQGRTPPLRIILNSGYVDNREQREGVSTFVLEGWGSSVT